VLVRLDNQERLILLGEGRELAAPDALTASRPAPIVPSPAKTPAKPSAALTDPNDDLF